MRLLSLAGLGGAWTAVAVGAGLGAVGALILMYFLKLKRIRREISSTFLWRKSVQDLHANSPFQRLRKNLLLFLQLLILLAALLALARPALLGSARTGASYIVLVDNSASMSSVDVPGGRLKAALGHAEAIVDDMGGHDAMMVLSFASRPKVVQTMTTDRNALLSSIAGIRPTDERTQLAGPLQLAASLAATVANPRIVVISDGGFAEDAAESVTAPVEFVAVGEGARNLGITAMDVRSNIESPEVGEIFAKVTNFFGQQLSTTVSLEVDGRLIDAQQVDVPSGTSHAAVFKVSLDVERIARVSIDAEDDLESDNSAWAILETPRDIQVILMGEGSVFLQRSISACPNFRLSRVSEGQPPVLSEADWPVFVCEGTAPAFLTKAGYLVFDALPPGGEFTEEGKMAAPVVLDVDDSHPVTAYLQLADLFIAEARKMSFPPETKVLVSSDQGPLLALSYAGGARVLTVAFNPINSRWPLRVSYPMFVANAINFLASSGEGRSARMIRTGDVLVLEGGEGADAVTVTDPEGRRTELPWGGEGTVAYGETRGRGIYTVETGAGKTQYVANLTDPVESNTRVRREFQVGSSTLAAGKAPSEKNREIWRELLLAAFVVLMMEWYIYNRRVYI